MSAARLGFIVVVLVVVAIANDWSIPDRLIVILVATMLLAWIWSRFSLQRLGLRRAVQSDRLRAGDWLVEEIGLHNHSWLPRLWIEVQDFSTLVGHRAGQVVSLRSHGDASWRVQTRCDHRGVYRLGPVVIRGGDPVGLFVQQRTIPAVHEVMVYPPVVDVREVPMPNASILGGAPRSAMPVSSAHTVAGVREYASGDPLNRISWGATARLGRMMVKEFDPEPSSDIWIMLDLGFDAPPGATGSQLHMPDLDAQHEYAIAVAGALVERCLGDGRKVGLIINRDMPIRFDPDGSHRQWLRVFETLAVVTPFGNRSLLEAIQADAQRFNRTTGVIIVTARSAGDWVPGARSLVQRQVPVTATLITAGETAEHAALMNELVSAHVAVAQLEVGQGMADVGEPNPPWQA